MSTRVDNMACLHNKVLPLIGGSSQPVGLQRLLFKRRSMAATKEVVMALKSSGGELSKRQLLQLIRFKLQFGRARTDWEAMLTGQAKDGGKANPKLALTLRRRRFAIEARSPRKRYRAS